MAVGPSAAALEASSPSALSTMPATGTTASTSSAAPTAPASAAVSSALSVSRGRHVRVGARSQSAAGSGLASHHVKGGSRGAAHDQDNFVNMNFLMGGPVLFEDCASIFDVDWDSVVQVRTRESGNCPICLDHPVAPRVTRCGHIFCFACALQMIEYEPLCPLCFQPVSRDDLRPIACLDAGPAPRPGDVLTFAQFRRPRLVRSLERPTRRFVSATRADIDAIVDFDRRDLQNALAALHGTSDAAEEVQAGFVRRALEECVQAPYYARVGSDASAPCSNKRPLSGKGARPAAENAVSLAATDGPPTEHFWYQHISGAPIFLDHLNGQMLKAQFGAIERAPPLIDQARVVACRWTVVDEELLRRAKFLSHLPMGAAVCFVECLPFDFLSPGVLQQFQSAIRQRSSERQKREQRERRESSRAQQRLEQEYRDSVLDTSSVRIEPQFVMRREEFVPLGTSARSISGQAAVPPGQTGPPAEDTSHVDRSRSLPAASVSHAVSPNLLRANAKPASGSAGSSSGGGGGSWRTVIAANSSPEQQFPKLGSSAAGTSSADLASSIQVPPGATAARPNGAWKRPG